MATAFRVQRYFRLLPRDTDAYFESEENTAGWTFDAPQNGVGWQVACNPQAVQMLSISCPAAQILMLEVRRVREPYCRRPMNCLLMWRSH